MTHDILPKRAWWILSLAVASSVAGTGCKQASSTRATSSDSAGIHIVSVSGDALRNAREWRLSAEPLVIVGTDSLPLAAVTAARVLPNQSIAVANAMTSEIYVLSRAGQLLTRIGRRGEGPAEFQSLADIYPWRGDSILAWDRYLRRASFFAVNGQHGETYTLSNVAGFGPALRGVFDDGTLLVSPEDGYKERDMNRVRRDSLVLVALKAGDLTFDTVAWVPGEQQYELLVPPMLLLEPTPFGHRTYIAVAANEILALDTDRSELRFLGRNGVPTTIVRLAIPRRPVTAADREAYQRANDNPKWRPSYLAAKRLYLKEVPYPDVMPPVGGLVVDHSGNYWVAEYVPEHEEATKGRTWWGFDSSGRIHGKVNVPPRFEVYDIGPDYLLGVQMDSLDVERVLLYGLGS